MAMHRRLSGISW